MRLTMLGTGHATVTRCYNTCFLFTEGNRHFLVDGGGGNGILRQLKQADIDWRDIREIFVTHKHMDHIMGIFWLMRMICQAMRKGTYREEVRLYGHEEVIGILRDTAPLLLSEKEAGYIGKGLFLIPVSDGETREILGRQVTFFDIHSTKAKQFGFCMELDGGENLTCCGDETVVLLSKLKTKKHINIELRTDEFDLTASESKATYAKIKQYVLEKHGIKVSSLNIAQIKQKCGIKERDNYNLSKKENVKQPQCTVEKEKAIMDAFRHFQMI